MWVALIGVEKEGQLTFRDGLSRYGMGEEGTVIHGPLVLEPVTEACGRVIFVLG